MDAPQFLPPPWTGVQFNPVPHPHPTSTEKANKPNPEEQRRQSPGHAGPGPVVLIAIFLGWKVADEDTHVCSVVIDAGRAEATQPAAATGASWSPRARQHRTLERPRVSLAHGTRVTQGSWAARGGTDAGKEERRGCSAPSPPPSAPLPRARPLLTFCRRSISCCLAWRTARACSCSSSSCCRRSAASRMCCGGTGQGQRGSQESYAGPAGRSDFPRPLSPSPGLPGGSPPPPGGPDANKLSTSNCLVSSMPQALTEPQVLVQRRALAPVRSQPRASNNPRLRILAYILSLVGRFTSCNPPIHLGGRHYKPRHREVFLVHHTAVLDSSQAQGSLRISGFAAVCWHSAPATLDSPRPLTFASIPGRRLQGRHR